MDVYFETRMGKPFCIEIGYFDTVLEIKEKVQKYQGIPISRQTLLFKGHCLEDGRDVEYCEIFHNSRIQLMLTPDTTVKLEDSPPKSSKIQVFIRMGTSKKRVEIDVDDTIVQFKEKICELESGSLNWRALSVYVHGNELHDNQFVRDYEISDNSEIDVLIKPLQNSAVTTVTTPATSGGGNSNSKRLKILVSTQCGTNKIPVEINASDNVDELRKELKRLQEILHFSLPPDGYFFIYKQNVMEDDRSFRWHHVSNGDMIEIFNGSVTGGSS
ncbi:ubiquitin domain-containing protein 7SL RNA1-like [Heracleum sosnowskyi]|uniref:Ubiquitin domain-containing protein 7SL RNA1-like n=1 Tax=Heracleum sosnowskyi TaxID=360622 RepID=A0AAD8I4E3_9APIA|nr:ubiquitin domain-containing protein 7SL RNA1-like [Heracleum sosnowskyi]